MPGRRTPAKLGISQRQSRKGGHQRSALRQLSSDIGMIRVRVEASSPLAKAGLESLLQAHPTLRLVEESSRDSSGTGAESPPDVLVVEAETLSDPAAREATEWAGVGGPVVLLVRHPANDALADALQAGVKAVLPSGLAGPEIVAAIEAAGAGLVVLDPTGIEGLLRAPSAPSRNGAESLVESLTPRELEVLRLLATGLGNKEIASRLGISDHTVKFHVASIMGKLGAGSRTEAVTLGIRHGLIMI
ncbi:MAG TPA: response regulator transcription factor [Terriglobia bacterium]|nr:response regulator transcription factor [Terriglobia bacterium]